MSLKPYDLYKDSGIAWLGEAPATWEVTAVKHGFNIKLGKMLQPEPKGDEDELAPYVRAANIQWHGIDTSDIKLMWFSPGERLELGLQKDDLLVSEGGDVGRACLWKNELDNCHFQNSVNRVRSKPGHSTRFARYWLSALKDKGFIDVLCNKSTIAHYTAEKLAATPALLPSHSEQLAIASFLDRETAKIDALIAEQQRLIELLQEKRQAVISHAVTKGLNPNAPMKASGVEWLGEVPEHWEIKRIKHLAKAISKGTTPSTIGAEFTPSGTRFIKAENIKSTGVELSPEFFISDETNQELSRSILLGGEVLVVIAGATTGKSAVIPKEICPANTNQAVCFIRTKSCIDSSFINHWLSQRRVQNHISLGSVQSAQPNLSMEDLGNIPIMQPPLEEMQQIASFCDSRKASAEVSSAESTKLIDLLKERRSALISAAVTGQIDVRALADAEEAT